MYVLQILFPRTILLEECFGPWPSSHTAVIFYLIVHEVHVYMLKCQLCGMQGSKVELVDGRA